ncbi:MULTISPECIES: HetP family heterocyst commitment protein [unclassified Anabaena]|uniref:HetP family heterocyst commitment protein n=1 Tax=unclassified Anabaena TaxID=2619674 RepID=UPI001687D03C|nr:HetP family heterocyst commitment protein [Anabaena sp. UHCC 0399]MBD2361126.1 HetP family heterocyst commitment protein [Anabaena minutissima FACHB-250]MEA5569371.1 HetP family heterocyst commitment protein [Anabaena sp. UHCC 0399]
MYQQNTNYNSQNVKKINNEQIEQIIKAIIAGKYSWACVLLLRFSGYNPMEYIPYRTYIRLLKNNCLAKPNNINQSDTSEVFHVQSSWMQNKNIGLTN